MPSFMNRFKRPGATFGPYDMPQNTSTGFGPPKLQMPRNAADPEQRAGGNLNGMSAKLGPSSKPLPYEGAGGSATGYLMKAGDNSNPTSLFHTKPKRGNSGYSRGQNANGGFGNIGRM